MRSENSRKIHSAVFFRGGAECKRPECNVKVRFVIQKERGKYVDVSYVGNVCHSSRPGVSDSAIRRNKRVRRTNSSWTESFLKHFYIIYSRIAQFRVRYDRWIEEVKTHFLQALPPSDVGIFTNSNEKETCLLLCLLCIFKFQTLTRLTCLYSVVIFRSKLDYYDLLIP